MKRALLAGLLATLAAPAAPAMAQTSAPAAASPGAVAKVHGIALVGTAAMPDGYSHFPWVNPDAPKGGEVVLGAVGTFDDFNPFIIRGTPPAGVAAVYDTLLVPNPDEPAASYGRLAETIELPADKSWVAFDLRPGAKFWDGTAVTAQDVAWTFDTLRSQGRPFYAQYYAGVDHVETDGARRVVFRFKSPGNRELPAILGELPVLPQHWWKGRDFSAPLSDPPLGSGPYRVDHAEFGRTLVMRRVPDYWGRDMPFERGLDNFETIRTEYFRDPSVAFEAFKAGQSDWRRETSSLLWSTGYDFPAARQGLVVKKAFPATEITPMQGFGFNLRRPLFKDARVREALAQVFDFEWSNRTFFYGLYHRTGSFFAGSDFAATGVPTGDELKLLEPFRAQLPPDLFSKPFVLAKTDGTGNNPAGLKRAYELLRAAGWTLKDHKLVDPEGEQFGFELLLDDPRFERIALPWLQQLGRLGIAAHVRTVDPSQYQQRIETFDYDATEVIFGESESPGNEQYDYWSCQAARSQGSGNIMGVCSPVIDALIGRVVGAQDKAQLVAATRALDRVLLWSWVLVPQFYLDQVWVAYWDRFGYPAQPVRTGTEFSAWWIDPAKAAKIATARGHGN
jgi:microcin C transport system substrate-binding protein